MKLCRFIYEGDAAPRYAIVEGEWVRPLSLSSLFENDWGATTERISLSGLKLLPPVAPSKIVCVGRNYMEHAAELGNKVPEQPLLFLKAPSSIISHEESILLPPESSQVEHEGELAIVVGKTARRLSEEDDPYVYVLGYTCINDVTARDLQRKDVQFTRAKSFDTFCPLGPFIETEIDPENLAVTTRVNGEVKQHASTSSMAFSIKYLLRYISNAMTLLPGDVIATGTPAGVSKLAAGDVVEVEVEGVGVLHNSVEAMV